MLLALGILGGMIWRTHHHFDTAISYVNYSHRIQNVSVDFQQAVIARLAERIATPLPQLLITLLSEIDSLMVDRNHFSQETRAHLETVRLLLSQSQNLDQSTQQKKFDFGIEINE